MKQLVRQAMEEGALGVGSALIYAPGFYTGYAALPFPDLRQAIEDGRSGDASEAANRITEAIMRATEVLKQGRG